MANHEINAMMETTMGKIKEMVDVNTVVGEPIFTPDGGTVIPVSKCTFGFCVGGSEFGKNESAKSFGGGSGIGVTVVPTAFLVIDASGVKLVPITPPAGNTVDRLVEMVPGVIDKITALFKGGS
ncbi:MAG: GerW family sporulation protein [Oscillospiraceae bacterium]|jgi:sporulation protein YtfJ|nr:GerW family sporulation protein [Oscillospiraceae bacterium]